MKIYNTLTRKTEDFTPIKEGEVRMYVCGPTVYNYFHIGNARPFVVFDAFRSYLKSRGYNVTFVQNVTDIDDKIINKAASEGVEWNEIAEKYTKAYFEDLRALNVEPADISPKATDEIDGMIGIISKLVEKGAAYVAKHGVYFSVEKFVGYGKLSHKNIDELREGARVEVDEQKKSPLDFALWKFSKEGEPAWASPWGHGRPGWHIECSAMSSKFLGETFDIHGGGNDLIFPHHENEIAQSEAATGKPFANYWMHNGFMNMKGEKMSKSVGNIVLAREVLEQYPAEVVRLFLLSAHYRGPIDFTKENIDSVKKGYVEISYTLQRLEQFLSGGVKPDDTGTGEEYMNEFRAALDDDFNTPKAIAVIYKAAADAKQALSAADTARLSAIRGVMTEMCNVLKITPVIEPPSKEALDTAAEIDRLRKEKNYAEADKLKAKISEMGYMLEFSKAGTFIIKEMK